MGAIARRRADRERGLADMNRFDTLILGAGHGGAQCAIALRQQGYGGSVAIVGAEQELPYERPPLSKDYLSGTRAFDRMLIRPASFWEERGIAILPGHEVTAIEPMARIAEFSEGPPIGFGSLVWSAGGAARKLGCGGADLTGVHSVRSRADVDRILAELSAAGRVIVIGGGYIGLEAAAVLTRLGKHVIVLEAEDRLLARVSGPPISEYFAEAHRRHGVDIRLGVKVDCITGETEASGVRLDDGSLLAADMVIVGVGITPAVGPLLAAGAKGENGVDVDEYCRTSLPDIYAIGDCAAHVNAFAGGARIRLESVQNAHDQAQVAAATICGMDRPYDAVPWFWSHQYDIKLQTVGLSAGHDDWVVRGDPGDGRFSVIYLREGKVIALDCVNMVKDYVQGRKLVAEAKVVAPSRLADVGIALKDA